MAARVNDDERTLERQGAPSLDRHCWGILRDNKVEELKRASSQVDGSKMQNCLLVSVLAVVGQSIQREKAARPLHHSKPRI